MPEELIEAKVAQILNARELVINVGGGKGVRPGTKFAVLAASPLEIRDPDSGEVLDLLDREKLRVEAKEVRAKVTICVTYEGRVIRSSIFDVLSSQQVAVTIRASDDSLPPPLAPEESYVKIGDRVRQIED